LPTNIASTITMSVEQQTGAPGDSTVNYSLTNCIGMGGGNPSGVGGNAGPFDAQICVPVRNSYDPNDKSAYPLGFGDDHVVSMRTPLDYTIRFQNTGNDTAFLVVLRDTLSSEMDYSSIEVLNASHAYKMNLLNGNILHFTFENILLPDSATNPVASQGFISFKIGPKASMTKGTKVDNRAAIYFDFNSPIITNTVSRLYDEYFEVVSINDLVKNKGFKVTTYPNPFVDKVTFSLPKTDLNTNCRLELFDLNGRMIETKEFEAGECVLELEKLPTNLFLWKVISVDGEILANGKVVSIK
jgi:uncharacterized repeat protein (TIGR01451 family)